MECCGPVDDGREFARSVGQLEVTSVASFYGRAASHAMKFKCLVNRVPLLSIHGGSTCTRFRQFVQVDRMREQCGITCDESLIGL